MSSYNVLSLHPCHSYLARGLSMSLWGLTGEPAASAVRSMGLSEVDHWPSLIANLLASRCSLRPLSKSASTFTFLLGVSMGALGPLPVGSEGLVRSTTDPYSFHLSNSEGPASGLPWGPCISTFPCWGSSLGPRGHCLWGRGVQVRLMSSLHAVLYPWPRGRRPLCPLQEIPLYTGYMWIKY